MMLTIHGLPFAFKYHDLKQLIKQECNLSDFILDNLVADGDSSKKVRIGVADESEGAHLIKCLDGYRMGGNVLRVLPVAKAMRCSITQEQRRLMLDFVKANPLVTNGRYNGPGGSSDRAKLLRKMAITLNNSHDGAIKTPGKWLRTWQDWKSVTKRKAENYCRLEIASSSTGLSEIEQELLEVVKAQKDSTNSFVNPLEDESNSLEAEIKTECVNKMYVEGTEHSDDAPSHCSPAPSPNAQKEVEGEETPRRGKKRKLEDDSISIEERMTRAMEQQASATSNIAHQLSRLADIGSQMIAVWAKSKRNHSENKDLHSDSD